MTWRDFLLFALVVALIAGLLGVIALVFQLEGDQIQWLEIVGICVVALVFLLWQRWRGE
jgi:uncharacterized membrane protein YfcA